jgi:hypothetical protein
VTAIIVRVFRRAGNISDTYSREKFAELVASPGFEPTLTRDSPRIAHPSVPVRTLHHYTGEETARASITANLMGTWEGRFRIQLQRRSASLAIRTPAGEVVTRQLANSKAGKA